ncbi:hypothetical protein TNCV_2828461 [Trichonephila clavipes]|nr:hypothetical protein TNCV_2828461 [Trichonephila clavipes]
MGKERLHKKNIPAGWRSLASKNPGAKKTTRALIWLGFTKLCLLGGQGPRAHLRTPVHGIAEPIGSYASVCRYSGLLPLRLQVRPRPKTVNFLDAENRQRHAVCLCGMYKIP